MKKLLAISVLAIMLVLVAVTGVNASTNSTLADDLYKIGAKYGMTNADKLKIEKYLANNPVSDAEANQVVAKANEAAKVMDDAGVTDVSKLTVAQKDQIKTIANQAADVIGVTLKFSAKSVEVYKDGTLVDSVSLENGKLAYTGNNSNVVLVVSAVAALALVAGFVTRKNLANA